MALIKDQARAGENWVQLADDAPLGDQPVLVSLKRWKQEKDLLRGRNEPFGVILRSDEGPEDFGEDLEDDLKALKVIALDFPAYTDGRSYSIARLLRDRHGYEGELRAVGDVLMDQLGAMLRCGFDALEVPDTLTDERIDAAINRYSAWYQPSGDGRKTVMQLRHGL